MALTLSFSICFNKCCKSIRLTDTTGATLTPADGSGEWNDTVTPASGGANDVASAYLCIYYPGTDHNTEDPDETIDLYAPSTSPLRSAITGGTDVTFNYDEVSGTWSDGMYTFIYQITDASDNVYSATIKSFNYCNTRHCVDNLAASIPEAMCDNCDYKETLENYLYAEAMLSGIISSVNCLNETAMNDTLDKIQDYCDFENCTDCN